MRESNWTRILARQPGWKYIRAGACSQGGQSSLFCRVVSITDLSLIVPFAESVSETILGVRLHWVFVVVVIVIAAVSLSVKGKSLAQRRRMRMAESRGAHFKGLLLLFAIPAISIFAVKKYKLNSPFQLNNYQMTPKYLLVLSKFSTPK
uniref:Putative ovule protein n=1 Tax=Solanum chacoense TaxID=4108 RepID=A0A0V0IUN6_SOLCH